MEKKPFMTFQVEKPFPGPVPHREGAVMELWEMGLVVVIQFPGLTRDELSTFHSGFERYSYLESPTRVPVAVWVFDFPVPHGMIDTVFNARVVKKDLIDDFLDTSKGRVRNILQFFLLDGQVLRGMKVIGLHLEAVELFHDTIRKQFAMNYNDIEFESCLAGFFTRPTKELFEMGRKFKHR